MLHSIRNWRPKIRYSLRLFLVLITGLSIWLSIRTNAAREQASAVRALNQPDVEIWYDYQFSSGDYQFENYDPNLESWAPRWLIDIFGIDFFHRVVTLNLVYSEGSGVQIANTSLSGPCGSHIAKLTHLRDLAAMDLQVTDDCLRRISKLRRLKRLHLFSPREVTDKGVAHLAKLDQLESVDVGFSKITDESLKVLGQLPELRLLLVNGCKFSDAGLAYLEPALELRELSLIPLPATASQGESEFTDAGLRSLARLPELESLQIQSEGGGGFGGPLGFTDNGLMQFASHEKLKELDIYCNGISEGGIDMLKQRLPKLQCRLFHFQEMATGGMGSMPGSFWLEVK